MFHTHRFVHELPELLDLQEKPAQIETDFPNTLLVLTDLRNSATVNTHQVQNCPKQHVEASLTTFLLGHNKSEKKRSARQNPHIPRMPVEDVH